MKHRLSPHYSQQKPLKYKTEDIPAPPTLVIFKMEGKEPTAFFPEEPGTNDPYTCTLYVHVGQHGHCSTSYASTLKPATPEQYAPLLKELESLGYENLKPVRKFTQKHLETRKAKLNSTR